ncbi:MAG: low affinity iron permease family protein [Marmoricola sp.]
MNDHSPTMPSEIGMHLGLFDRFAGAAGKLVSRAPFFAASVAIVIAWIIEGVFRVLSGGGLHAVLSNTYQLQINTLTTIITFLLVALLQNTQTRGDDATQQKLNAIADALADLMEHRADRDDDDDLRGDLEELRKAVGLEDREGTGRRN